MSLLLRLTSILISITIATALPTPQSGDNGGSSTIPAGDIGSSADPSNQGPSNPGASGKDTGSVNLSKGATIAISVVVGIVVILGITSAVLFYLTKKRQWQLRERMRRSARRVASAVKTVATPRTSHKMTFSPIEKKRLGSLTRKNKKTAGEAVEVVQASRETASKTRPAVVTKNAGAEKDAAVRSSIYAVSVVAAEGEAKTKPQKKAAPPNVAIPTSSFEFESPKTPVWARIFGR